MADRVQLGTELPNIVADLSVEERAWAVRHLVVPLVTVETGTWNWASMPEPRAGVIILDGLLAHRVTLAGQVGTDLLGRNHVVHPWRSEPKVAALVDDFEWRALAPTTLGVLDREYLAVVARVPSLAPMVAALSVDHSSMVACQMATLAQPHMEDRLLMLFWHMAERWGSRTPAGVTLELPGLTQSVLAEAIAASRQSVSRAVSLLRTLDLIRGRDGRWLLLEDAPAARASLKRHREQPMVATP